MIPVEGEQNGLKMYGGRTALELKESYKDQDERQSLDTFKKFM